MLDEAVLPSELREVAFAAWTRIEMALSPAAKTRIERACAQAGTRSSLTRVLAMSEYVATVAQAQGDWFARFVADDDGGKPPQDDFIGAALEGDSDIDGLKRALRRLRARVLVHIIWRDVLGLADFDETAASVTRFAEQSIGAALARLHDWAVARDGVPIGAESGGAQSLVVVALGKLGAGELNLSSDVDLVFAYPEAGETASKRRTNQQFFVRLSQRLIQVLDDLTSDGFVFRVDMRLRPYGESGALVLDFGAMELYFQEQGRDWERYAWIRARPCAGDVAAGARLILSLRPFVFRRYLDFGAVQALRDLKSRIDAERDRDSLRDDIKLGPGGIREVEFVAQMLQIIWAGREPQLMHTRMQPLLAALADKRLMSAAQSRELGEAYVFLRNAEHKIQAIRDEQTQRLPETGIDRARLASMMGCANWQDFRATLDLQRRRVANAFESLLTDTASAEGEGARFVAIWRLPQDAEVGAALAADGFGEVALIAREVHRLRVARDRPRVGGEGRQRFDALMPRVLAELAKQGRRAEHLARLTPLFEAVMRRSSYFALLCENPAALALLIEMCSQSRWISAELARYPVLLDELLDPALLYTVADRAALAADLARRLRNVGDLEGQIEVLRTFKETHQFRVAACELRGILPLMKISDYLTFLAEVILAAALDIAWTTTAAGERGLLAARPFVIVGYGKLGGLELGPGSDLDLVFLHDLPDDHGRFLARLVRRLLHILTARTQSGALYEVDTRLRPSGRRGTMVSSIAGFERYQREDAWVWEHQALVRARVVAGDPALAERFERCRRDIVRQERESAALKREIVEMRSRIEETAEGKVDLKREPGGIVDIEFMVQYLALAFAASYPALADWTDNVRILDAAAEVGLVPKVATQGLKEAYLALRTESHRTALDLPDDARAREVLERYRNFVRTQWRHMLEEL